MKFFKDVQQVIQDLLNLAQEKSTSPLAGTFTFFFLLYNWKPLFYFFKSDDAPKIKISHIESLYTWDYDLNLITPLGLAIISLLAYTVLSGITLLIWRVLHDGLDKLTLKALKKATFLTHEQEKILRDDLEAQTIKHRKVIDVYQQKLLAIQRVNKNILVQSATNKPDMVSDDSSYQELLSSNDINYLSSSSEGKLKLNQYIGEKVILDIDDSHAINELKSVSYLILSAIKGAPNSTTINSHPVKVGNHNGAQISISKPQLNSFANKLNRLGLLKVDSVENGFEYTATNKLINELFPLLPN